MPVEWSVRKFTGYDPEIGTEGYADTIYSLSLEPRFVGVFPVRQVMYGYRIVALNPKRTIQPDSHKMRYWSDLDLPFSIVSVYVADNDVIAEKVAQQLSPNAVVFSLADWNTVEEYLCGGFVDEDIQETFQDPDTRRDPACLGVAYALKTLIEKAFVISDERPFDPDELARVDQVLREEVEWLEITVAS